MDIEPITGVPARFPAGRVRIRLGEEHRGRYQALYAHYGTVVDGLPVLGERDFDGRTVTVTLAELESLNRGLASLGAHDGPAPSTAFGGQERAKNRLFKRLQYLS